MVDHRYVRIAQGLLAKTRDRKVDWRKSDSGAYVTKFGEVQISFYASERNERLVIYTVSGSVAAIFDSSDLKDSDSPPDILRQLARLVRNQVDRVDETIDALAEALDEST